MKIFLLGLVVGFVIGYALGFFVDQIDKGIKDGRR